LIECPGIEVIVEATGVPDAGIAHALKAIEHGKHIVMVNVEADVVAGPLLARRAKAAGVVYSLAWGDQPALICEHVDWARAAGFKVICAGKGTRYEPHYHKSNPDNVWDILDKYLNISDRKSINPKMFNSFVDGTKSGIEMTAVCNSTGLVPQSDGLRFAPATRPPDVGERGRKKHRREDLRRDSEPEGGDPEPLPAGRQDVDPRHSAENRRRQAGRRVDDMLAIVEQQQHSPVPKGGD